MENAIKDFSALSIYMRDFSSDLEFKKLTQKSAPFPKTDLTEDKRLERVKLSAEDYWFFDKTYFSDDMYSDGYSEPADYHRFLITDAGIPGISINLGPRKMGKTAFLKKRFAWGLLTGKFHFSATLSSTLPTSRNILADIVELIGTERIVFDFKPELLEANKDQFTMRVQGINKLIRVIALSEGRSARGATLGFSRPKFVLCDDIETRQSSLGEDQVQQRIKIIQETFQSMSENGTLVVLGNNFDVECALNKLLVEHNQGLLPDFYRVNVRPAWDIYKGSLWYERYPARTEEQLKAMLKVTDITEWLGEFQQEPTPSDGFIFKRLNPLPEYTELPSDARGVIYCDPNLSKKGKGDNTAIVKYLYSPTTDCYYIAQYLCRSFSDSDALLNNYLSFKDSKVRACGFDGNVSQESTWTNNVRNWCRQHNSPFPTIFYKKYRVDELSKNAELVWNAGKIKIPAGMSNAEEGKKFLNQMFSFRGKKTNSHDDAPDALVCAHELIHERGLASRASNNVVKKITDFFNF